jgi:hypothetical protein
LTDAKDNFREEVPLKGRIKQITEGKVVTKYNENGNIIEECRHTSDGKIDYSDVYKYNDNGDIIENCYYKSDRKFYYRDVYKYNENKNIAEKYRFTSDDEIEEIDIYKYNEIGYKIERSELNSNGEFYIRMVDEYDNNNNHISRFLYDSDTYAAVNRRLISHNEYGDIIGDVFYSAQNLIYNYYFQHEYDDNGSLIEIRKYTKGTLIEKINYTYDKNGRLSEYYKYDSDPLLNRKFTFKHDKIGNRVEEKRYDEDGNIFEEGFKLYTYDEKKIGLGEVYMETYFLHFLELLSVKLNILTNRLIQNVI